VSELLSGGWRDPSINQSINQQTNQPTNQPTNQSIHPSIHPSLNHPSLVGSFLSRPPPIGVVGVEWSDVMRCPNRTSPVGRQDRSSRELKLIDREVVKRRSWKLSTSPARWTGGLAGWLADLQWRWVHAGSSPAAGSRAEPSLTGDEGP
jgi:hypothetical protein